MLTAKFICRAAAILTVLGFAGCAAVRMEPPSRDGQEAGALRPTVATEPTPVVNAAQVGVVGDGSTVNTAAVQRAIDNLSRRGGGVLLFPAGRYVTGTVALKDNVRLRLADGAVLLGSHNAADYLNLDPFKPGDGKATFGYALVTAVGASHVGIEGPGIIDGQGKALKAAQARYDVRPFLVRWEHCRDVTVRDVHLTDPGAWTMQFFQCSGAVADHVTIRSAGSHLINNDGIDIDSSRDVAVTDCDVESGDDAICVKTTSPQACGNLTITGCTLKTNCNGIKLGTESLGDFSNVRASHCHLHDIGMAGIALYCVDGADLHDATFSDLTMDNVAVPISIRLGSRLKTFRPGDRPRPVGMLRDVTIDHVRATRARQIGLLVNGIPDHPVQALHLEQVDITVNGGGTADAANVKLPERPSAYPEMSMFGTTMPAYGAYLRHVSGVTCDRVVVSAARPDARPAAVLIDVGGATTGNFLSGD